MNNLINNLSIKTKIMGSALLLLVLMLGGAVFALSSLHGLGAELQAIAEQNDQVARSIGAISSQDLEQAWTDFCAALETAASFGPRDVRFAEDPEERAASAEELMQGLEEATPPLFVRAARRADEHVLAGIVGDQRDTVGHQHAG